MPKTISAQISDELAEDLDKVNKETGISKTQIIEDGVRHRLKDIKRLFSNDDLIKR